MKKLKLLILSLVSLIMFTGCTVNENKQEKLEVKVQVWAMKYLVEEIGKEHVNVALAVESGDAHHKEPTQKEIAELSKSSLFFYISAGDLGREAEELMKAAGSKEKNVDLFEHVEALQKGAEKDAHAWLSPKQMQLMAQTVKEKLIAKKADQKSLFEANYNALTEKLKSLDETVTKLFAQKTKSEILVEHAAYGYLARDYGFAQHALTDTHDHDAHAEEASGTSSTEHSELSASQVETLKKVVAEEGFKTLFADSQNQSETITKIAKELGITLERVSTLETLSKEEAKKDYIEHIKEIAQKFAKELE